MISLYCWNSQGGVGSWLDPALLRDAPERIRGADVVWIDLADPTPEEEQLVFGAFFPVHALTLEDITKLRREPGVQPHFPKVEEFRDYLFVVVNPLDPVFLERTHGKGTDADGAVSTQLSAVLTEKLLITHHYRPVAGIDWLRNFLDRYQATSSRGPDYLFHLVLDVAVDQYVPVLDRIDDRLDGLEEEVFSRPSPHLAGVLLRLKRQIVLLRKALVYEREVLARLARGDFALIDEREMVYYRNVYDHVVRFTELIESSREMVSDLMQSHLAATSNKLNEIMKVLTMISTVVLPMTLIAGVYGMNFEHMPELKWWLGYPFALSLMTLFGAAAFIFFRWRRWI